MVSKGKAVVLSSNVDADELSQFCKLLSDPMRMKLALLLKAHGELHVQPLCQHLGQSQPAVSHHLALLRNAGLIDLRREGKCNFYRLNSKHFRDFVGVLAKSLVDDEEDSLGLLGEFPFLYSKDTPNLTETAL